ncbi:transporter substrate-binding domain-containing protein [Mesorhizobium sp. WSM4935]|uniref:transporter substrate-binding domain-containing protein n=1 Tax=Mesorhizobium sp. WSM4935 TaxID=3038547 RepID=UPI002414D187|nr:transporter substrate-binding domain-containing protein [Mesorhizobium sp. WSM4935]MDG4874299.1 transporter substrate-binding domain-containing protein [Mesorhizobium sp. WSM4935]
MPYAALCYTFATLKDSDVAKALPADDNIYSLDKAGEADKALAAAKAALKAKTIGTLSAGMSVTFVDTYLKGIAQTKQYKTPQAFDLDLVANRVDAVIGAKDTLLGAAKKPGNDMTIAGACFAGGVVGKGAGVGLGKSDPELKASRRRAEAAAGREALRRSRPWLACQANIRRSGGRSSARARAAPGDRRSAARPARSQGPRRRARYTGVPKATPGTCPLRPVGSHPSSGSGFPRPSERRGCGAPGRPPLHGSR